jgi:hypothetical protein
MKKSNLLILLVLGALAIAWTTAKKRKAGPLILELDEGEYLPDDKYPDEETKTLFDI